MFLPVSKAFLSQLTFTQILDELDDTPVHAFPFTKLHFGRVTHIVFFDKTNRVEHDEAMVCNRDDSIRRGERFRVALSSKRREEIVPS